MLAKIVEAGTALVCKQATPETGITAADWLQMWAVCCSKWLQRRGSVIADARAASGYLQCKSCTPRPRPVFAAAPVDFIHLQRNRPSSTAQLPKLHPRLWSHHSGAMFWCRAVKHKACCTRLPPPLCIPAGLEPLMHCRKPCSWHFSKSPEKVSSLRQTRQVLSPHCISDIAHSEECILQQSRMDSGQCAIALQMRQLMKCSAVQMGPKCTSVK